MGEARRWLAWALPSRVREAALVVCLFGGFVVEEKEVEVEQKRREVGPGR